VLAVAETLARSGRDARVRATAGEATTDPTSVAKGVGSARAEADGKLVRT